MKRYIGLCTVIMLVSLPVVLLVSCRQQPAAPAANRIAFASTRDGDLEIYMMDADGSNQTRLTNNPANDASPAWSPDGSRITFHSNRGGDSEIWVMDTNGSNQIRLTNNPAYDECPAWSPDGSRPHPDRGQGSSQRSSKAWRGRGSRIPRITWHPSGPI